MTADGANTKFFLGSYILWLPDEGMHFQTMAVLRSKHATGARTKMIKLGREAARNSGCTVYRKSLKTEKVAVAIFDTALERPRS
jgi:hypothetical protein